MVDRGASRQSDRQDGEYEAAGGGFDQEVEPAVLRFVDGGLKPRRLPESIC